MACWIDFFGSLALLAGNTDDFDATVGKHITNCSDKIIPIKPLLKKQPLD
jgi:hypothetical protein